MQDGVEQQLLTCQAMFLDIEQKVAALSPCPLTSDLGSGGSQREAAELLASKLEHLKADLVGFQQVLQGGPGGGRGLAQEQEAELGSRRRRSSSVQEMFSSPRNQLLRQSSLQQQKELEEELTRQRGLTRDISRQGSKPRPPSPETEDHAQPSPRSPPVDVPVGGVSPQPTWDRLQQRLLALEGAWLLPPGGVTDSSVRRRRGAAGGVIGEQTLKELRTHISQLGALGRTAEDPPDQTSLVGGAYQTLDEGLFYVLHGVSLSLSAIHNLLQSPEGDAQQGALNEVDAQQGALNEGDAQQGALNEGDAQQGALHEGDTQQRALLLQSLSSELAALGRELASQGSKVSRVLGSKCAQQCVDDVCRLLPVIRAALTGREEQLKELQEELTQQQAGAAMQQQGEQESLHLEEAGPHHLPSCVLQQGEPDGALAPPPGGVEAEQQLERVAHSMEELLALGSQRLAQHANGHAHDRAHLQQQHSRHTRFFQFLGYHVSVLQHLSRRVPDSAPQRWEVVVTDLQREVERQQQVALETGTRMLETLQMWSQWEQDSVWSEALLSRIETSLPTMHQEDSSEEQTSERLTVYQEVHRLFEENNARFSRMLEAGLWLHRAGCRGVGVATGSMEKRWRVLHRRVDRERTSVERDRKLQDRFLLDSAALADWMGGAREMIDRWSQVCVSPEESDAVRSREDFLQFVALTSDLEARSGLKVAVILAGTQLLQLREVDPDPDGGPDPDPDGGPDPDPDGGPDPDPDGGPDPDPDGGPENPDLSLQLRRIEADWSGLLVDISTTQQALHERWMRRLTQQEALLELQVWLDATESRLEEHLRGVEENPPRDTDLSRILKFCKESQTEMLAHRATMDHVNQHLQTCSSMEDQRRRCELNRFAEEQGSLALRWLRLQGALGVQIQEAELELGVRVEQEVRLQQIRRWISDQTLWMDSAQMPRNRMQLQSSISTVQVFWRTSAGVHLRRSRLLIHPVCSTGPGGEGPADGGSSPGAEGQTGRRRRRGQQLQASDGRVHPGVFPPEPTERFGPAEAGGGPAALGSGGDGTEAAEAEDGQNLSDHGSPLRPTGQPAGPEEPPAAAAAPDEEAGPLEAGPLEAGPLEAGPLEAGWDQLRSSVSALGAAISPPAAALLQEQLDRQRDGWVLVTRALDQQLQRGRDILQVWEPHAHLAASLWQRLRTLQSDAESVLKATPPEDPSPEQVAARIHSVQTLLLRTDALQTHLGEELEASHHLIGHIEPTAAGLVQSESRMLAQGVQQLRQTLTGRRGQLQAELGRLERFSELLASLEESLDVWEERLRDPPGTPQQALLEPSGRSADLDVLNELSHTPTPGVAPAAPRLHRLNRRWAAAAARAQEACSERQTEALRQQNFQQKCESWMSFLQRMEDGLAVGVAGSYAGLRQQLCTLKRFQAELSTGHQILHAVLSDALHLLHRGQVEDRGDFVLKLARLREHWQGAVLRAEQRRLLVEGLVKHWHQYGHSLARLQRFLGAARALLPPAGPARCSLQQLRRTLQDLQHTELLFQRYQCGFVHTLDVGRQLFSMGDEETQTRLQADLGALQEEWDELQSLLGRRMELTDAIIKNWERCEAGLASSMMQLKDVKTRLNESMPESDDELARAEGFNQENEDALEDWAERLAELSAMKTDLSQFIITDDVLLLQEQVEHLTRQWEELCLKVSLRKQEIADRLNAWIIFNQKNKELCDWLTHMENKVAHNSDLNIEEMVEKLKKDCMEEINLFSENKTHLKQLGEQLISATNRTKEAEVGDTLKDVNARWQHLFDHIEARVRKLKETLVTVQQLDKNMSNLRTWLSRIEAELAKPVVYSMCHSDEIQRKLAEQQDLQRDIEQHTDSVASVLTLCDVLLHDADACGSDSENDSIQQTTHSLDRRWRNICAMSMERRMRIEETWRLWCKFQDDYSRFEDWLKMAELTAANPESANVLYTSAKEELKKFEAFQRQVHERLTQLELVNKQYRRLSRENRTDAASRLKVMVHDGNQRWDSLQKRVAAVLRRLKHFTAQREDFEGTREGILVWLTEMDLQLTNVEHFSESDMEEKMRQLDGFQQEITLNTNKIDALIVFGENLIQKSAPLDAVLIEDELEELHSYCQEVFGRVARFHHRLVTRRPVLVDEGDPSDPDTDLEDSPGLPSWREVRKRREEEEVPAVGGVPAGRQVMCHLLVPPLEQSGRETPVSVDSIPLEWDHTVDVGGSSSHEDDEDATFFSALSVKSAMDSPSWHRPGSPERKRPPRGLARGLSSSPTPTAGAPFPQQGYVKLLSDCSGSITSLKRVKLILNDDEEPEEPGLGGGTADKQTSTGVIERWELLQAPKFNDDDARHDLEQWQKLTSDLCDITSWLGRVLPELERLQRIPPSTAVRDFEVNIRKLKEMQKTFTGYKCLMISVNLSSRHFLRGDGAELRELQEALSSANHSWTQACGGLQSWEGGLHAALLQCQEFHQTLHALLLWLARTESRIHAAAAPLAPRPALLERRDALKTLEAELVARQRQVSSLQEISSQLLLEASGEDSLEAREKVHVIGNKLRLLLRQVAAHLSAAEARLETGCETETVGLETQSWDQIEEGACLQAAPGDQSAARREEQRDSAPRRSLLYRVVRAAFPLQLLFLLLLLLTCLTENDSSCSASNTFARSFYPMLRYTNGPPPT